MPARSGTSVPEKLSFVPKKFQRPTGIFSCVHCLAQPAGERNASYSTEQSGREKGSRMRAPLQAGDFPFPVKYGYCAVGFVEEGPAALVGGNVFALHPHQADGIFSQLPRTLSEYQVRSCRFALEAVLYSLVFVGLCLIAMPGELVTICLFSVAAVLLIVFLVRTRQINQIDLPGLYLFLGGNVFGLIAAAVYVVALSYAVKGVSAKNILLFGGLFFVLFLFAMIMRFAWRGFVLLGQKEAL